MNAVVPWRKIVQEELDMLASAVAQRDYEANVPYVDVTRELVAGWFDDSYHPDEFKFRSCFTSDELAALAEFHQKYEVVLPSLPPSLGTVETWLAYPAWRDVMESARHTRGQLAG